MLGQHRRFLLQLLQAGLNAVDGRAVTRAALAHGRLGSALDPTLDPTLDPKKDSAPSLITSAQSVSLFAVGKAAASMSLGAADALGARLRQALVITRDGHAAGLLQSLRGARLIESAHPLPDERSLAAGQALLAAVQALAPGNFPLFLVSGGASSLVEVLQPGVTLRDLQQCNAQGLASGMDIATLNRQRAALSLLKGGGLAAAVAQRSALALFISDVAGDSPDVIGSGLLGNAPVADRIERRIVASVDHACAAVAAAARAAGQVVHEQTLRFAGDAVAMAQQCVATLRRSPPGLTVWGGESTVQLPTQPGRGGRNQHLALAAALALADSPDLLLLAAGTDGSDGNSDDAGALVDGGSVARMREQGVDPLQALARADSGTALAESCDLIHTGPTGTNVGDLIIGLRLPSTATRHAAGPGGVV